MENGQTEEKIPNSQTRPRVKKRWPRELGFALAAIVLVLALLEVLLRFTGYRYVAVPILRDAIWGAEQFRAMNEDMGHNLFRPDDLLFWTMIPGVRLDIRTVNDLGLLNGPIAVPKPAASYRILCLGDSCTALGPVDYPMVLQKRLEPASRSDRRFEVINAGVFGFSSLQGLRLLRDRLAGVDPALVTVLYGWNDHYLTVAYPDNLVRSRATAPPFWIRLLRRLRLYQIAQQAVATAEMQRSSVARIRVAPQDYRENLAAIVELAAERGARPILMTSPSNHSVGNVPAFFIEQRMAESDETLITRHRQYNQIVREVAAGKKAELLDLEAIFDQRDKNSLFLRDGVHENPAGRHLIADSLIERFAAMRLLTPDDLNRIAQKPAFDSLDPNLLRSRIEFLKLPLQAKVGQPLPLDLRVTNLGDTVWLARTEGKIGQVLMSVIIYDMQGRHLFEKEGSVIPKDVQPGETFELHWATSPFTEPGHYVLEVEPVAGYVMWFSDAGDKRTTTTLTVETR